MAEILSPFVWGASGTKLTPDQIEQQRRVAEALSRNSNPAFQNAGMLGVIGQGLEGAYSGWQNTQLDRAEADNNSYNQTLAQELLGGAAPSMASQVSATAPESTSASVPAVDISGNKQAFVESLLPAAIETSQRTGVDPRIIVAQAAQETGWGRSAPGNNYFGIKSHGQAGGQTLSTEEVINGQRVRVNDSFRQFASPADSVRGYGDFITQNPRYQALREAQGLDNQLAALQASGYATDPNYARSVGAIARGIQLPQEVASLEASPQTASDAIDAQMAPPREVGPTPGSSMPMVAQAAPAQTAIPGMNEAIVRAMTDPLANSQTKAIAQILMQQQMARQQAQQEMALKQADPAYQLGLEKTRLEVENMRNPRLTPADQLAREKFAFDQKNQGRTADINEYEYAKQNGYQGSFVDFQLAQKKAGASSVTVNNQDQGEFAKKAAGRNVERFGALADAGTAAASVTQALPVMRELLSQAPQGPVQGRLAEMFPGFSSAADAFQAQVSQIAPTLRVPGSGAQSDRDMDLLLGSFPRLRYNPSANAIIVNLFEKKAQMNTQRGEIAAAALRGEITPEDADKRISALDKTPLIDDKTRAELSRGNEQAGDAPPAPEGMDPNLWKFMTPEERRLFQ